MACALIASVVTRVKVLQAKFVDAQIAAEIADPIGFAPDPESLAAFRLLVHAEIEEYLERKAREGLKAIEDAFNSGVTSVRSNLNVIVIACLLDVPLRFDSLHWQEDVKKILRLAEERCGDNNGIKETSFSILSVFSGKMPDEIDPALAANLSAYGTERGAVAHKSVTRVTTIQTPSEEAKKASDLLSGLCAYFS
jgi:hypothetical protein